MKSIIFAAIAVFVLFGVGGLDAHAQMMMQGFSNSTADWSAVVEHTDREEAEGKEVWDKLQSKELNCTNLNEDQFGVLGEYFMGQMMGESHTAMNAMMIQMHGEEGEEQIHVVMGKRLSGCDTSAAFPLGSGGWMPIMQMMWGGWSSPSGNITNNSMMQYGFGSYGMMGWLGSLTMFVWLVVGIFAAIWLWKQIKKP